MKRMKRIFDLADGLRTSRCALDDRMKRILYHSDGWDIFRYIEISIRKHKVARAGPAVTAQDADGTALGAGPVARRKMQMALKLASGPAVTTQDADPFELSVSCFGVMS